MPYPNLRQRLQSGETLFTAWSTIPDPLVTEFVARAGFDTVTLDMQHGNHSTESVMQGIAAVKLTGKPSIVRIPIGQFAMASRVLDFGASAVIAPMVNSVEDAKAFAAAMKFPPLGERSWGPTRVLALHGIESHQKYLETANDETVSIAMIETRAAYDALDDIMAVEGIDGVFVGPSDLSLALSNGARIDPNDATMLKMAQEIADRATKAGKFPCTLAGTAEGGSRARDLGFRLIALASDIAYLRNGANAMVDAARKG